MISKCHEAPYRINYTLVKLFSPLLIIRYLIPATPENLTKTWYFWGRARIMKKFTSLKMYLQVSYLPKSNLNSLTLYFPTVNLCHITTRSHDIASSA